MKKITKTLNHSPKRETNDNHPHDNDNDNKLNWVGNDGNGCRFAYLAKRASDIVSDPIIHDRLFNIIIVDLPREELDDDMLKLLTNSKKQLRVLPSLPPLQKEER